MDRIFKYISRHNHNGLLNYCEVRLWGTAYIKVNIGRKRLNKRTPLNRAKYGLEGELQ